MIKFTINENEYTLEYSFGAAEHKDTVQKMFNVLSGAYLVNGIGAVDSGAQAKEIAMVAMLKGTSDMVSDIPSIVKTCFYSGLLENNPVSEKEAYELMKQYMKENKISFKKLFEDIKKCMEDDGFFDLSGLTEMMKEMAENAAQAIKKIPQDHKKKSTSTK